MSAPIRTDRPIEMIRLTVPCKFDRTGEMVDVPIVGEPVTPGLAITPALVDGYFQGGWTFTHVPSGHSVAGGAMCLNCCRAIAADLARYDGWDRDKESVITDPNVKPFVTTIHQASFECDGYRCRPWTAPLPVINAAAEAVAR